MASTQTSPSSLARQPIGVVLINGVQVPCTEWEVTSNGYYRADTFSISVAASGMPKGLQSADLANMDQITVEIRASVDGSKPTSLIIGIVSDFDQDWRDGLITMTGRDHTADFIEAKTTEKFQNQTSAQIVTTLAGRHGLTADVQATSTLAGRYYEIDHDRLTDQTTEWDLITYLAQKEGYDAWVTGTTLHFKPATLVEGTPVQIRWTPPGTAPAQGAFVKLSTRRNLTLAPDAQVIVYSWNHRQKAAFKAIARATKSRKSQSSGGTSQIYTFRVPGLTHDQALQLAQSKLEEITRHERNLEIEMAGDVTLTARNQIQLQGTSTAWDQLYWIDEISRSQSFGAFTQTVKAKNHSPQSVVSV